MRRLPLLVAGAAVGLASCDSASSTIPDLGDAYVVEMDSAPLLDGDVLQVTVSYSGGCERHEFELGTSATGPEHELWLKHDANNDTCEAYITERLRISVPRDALQGRPVRLYISTTETIVLTDSLQQ
ncbi:MAG: hypothetical protein AAF170_14165 [Bacteroidota bacterium]